MPALDALLTERNVSRAARRLGISQPACSGALARLRRHFDDELLVRHGHGYRLTPLAERLAPLVKGAVSSTSHALSTSAFDPLHDVREFTIAASDYVQAVFAPPLVNAVRSRAPAVDLRLVSPFTEPFRTGKDVIAGTDGWLAPREVLHDEQCTGLLEDRWVCVVADNHPTVGDELSLDDLRDLPWVAPTIRGNPLSLHFDGLLAHGIEPKISVTTASFTAVPFLVSGTDRIGILQCSLAHKLAAAAAVRILECPWPVQPLHLTLWWDAKWEADPAHIWLRGIVENCMATAELIPDSAGVPAPRARPGGEA